MNKNEPTKRHKTDLEDEYSPESDFNGIDFSLLEACGAEEPNSEASNEEVEEVETKEEKPQGEDQENEDKRQQMAREMAHGQMIANAYKRPAIFLLVFDCNTFLPLRAGPTKKCEPIYLLQVNGNHWVLALLQGKDAMKSIPPPVLATWMTTKTWLSHI
ncbi:hypothetical protein PSTG_14717 [Puccinia striiformis f. sp. tritici PST-78]|uniref:Uncharacterized protein n=1 Tax=Puccinia striiformis f. sp. tritici PST-78 TaxID=1165861 RepID=A0A0L0UXT9_9BASI|nr:hypothetical protein PSTG_14717 [Puccinia striiformis f. sp. tritici PST-78]